MQKHKDPRVVVKRLLKRSTCAVQVAAVLSDKKGVFAWGINHMGPHGFGECAEIHALKRANHKRVAGAVLWVAGRRAKSGNRVNARPCAACQPVVKQCLYVMYRDKQGVWRQLEG